MCEASEAANADGGACYGARRFADAAEAYGRAIDLSTAGQPRLAVYYSNRAQARLKLELAELAAHDAALALAFDPQLWKAALRRGLALEQVGRATEAAALPRSRCIPTT